jgi:hypothetical protein
MKDAKDSKFYVNTKHIDMHHYSILELVSCGGIKNVSVSTSSILPNALTWPTFEKFVKVMTLIV